MSTSTRNKLILIAFFILLLIAAGTLLAQSGGGFDLSWHTIDGGGGISQGGAFSMSGTIGQPDTARLQGGAFDLQGGFWAGGCLAPGAVLPGIGLVSGYIELVWTAVPQATIYHIHRSANDPYFVPGPGTLHDSAPASPWTDPDPNAAGNPAMNYYYVVRAANGCGESLDSHRLGEFDFAIVPGT